MRIDDTVPAYTVEAWDTISFVCTVDGEMIEEIMTVNSSYGVMEQWCLNGYSHTLGETVTRYVDPDLEVDIMGEL